MITRVRLRWGSFFAALAVFGVLVCLFVLVVLGAGRESVRVSLGKSYFFLVRECEETTAAAVAGETYGSGGAGYVLREGADRYVVVACYYRRSDARRIGTFMDERGIGTEILERSPSEFRLRGARAAEAARVEANAETADTCARVLYETANGLEQSRLSQNEARAAARGVAQSLRGLRASNGGGLYTGWNADLARCAERADEIADGILFAKDLRSLQVELCVLIVNASSYFA